MSKQIKSILLIVCVLAAFCFCYESSIRRLADCGGEWLRRHNGQFCQAGYRLHSEFQIESVGGITYNVYVFEANGNRSGPNTGVQVLLETLDHQELHRIAVPSPDRLFNTTCLNSIHPNRLELSFFVAGEKRDMYCYYWEVQSGRLIPSSFGV
ncbi:hypothetical protein [Bremerella cremea]|uniref:hypothetical protein n=1 Tax=Bremerella cremea TaxID=1031537 RepID=UPI0031EB47FD